MARKLSEISRVLSAELGGLEEAVNAAVERSSARVFKAIHL